jgi:hypothetical protein
MIPLRQKKAVAPLFILLGFILVLVIIYLILFIPIPEFTNLRTQINYFLIVIFWVLLQVGLILGYYKIAEYSIKGLNTLRFKVMGWSLGIRDYIITHS